MRIIGCFIAILMTTPLSMAQEQVVDPAPSGNEVEILSVNPDTGAAVGTPGQAVIDQMPSGPQTSHDFTGMPEAVHPDDTTVIFDNTNPN